MPKTRTPEDNQIAQLDNEVTRLNKKIAKYEAIELKQNKFGLVWLDVPEAFEDDVENKLPILEEVPKLAINSKDGKPTHLLIEGDNYHALTCLNYTHKGKVDVIYIDPPYNTGSDGFKYKDKRYLKEYPDGTEVPVEHPLRHSYWLSFMKKRLELARELLKDTGVMFISIDDNEIAQLKLLCIEVFKKEELVDVMVWRKSGVGRDGKMKNTTTLRKDHEYIIVCFKRDKYLNKIIETPNFVGTLSNPDNDPRGNWLSGSISRKEEASNSDHEYYYTVISPSGKRFTRQWDIPEQDFKLLDKQKKISWGESGGNVPRIKIFEDEERTITPYSILLNKGTTTDGTKEVSRILNKDCSDIRPKPTKLIGTLIQLASPPNGIILDFFAGTGTTGHATIKLNEKDKGSRQFILVTNNENGICSDYCYPRIKNIINGYSFNGEFEEELLGIPIDWDDLFDSKIFESIKENIKDVVSKNSSRFTKIDTYLDGPEVKVTGINNIKEKMAGVGGSLAYFKASFVGKNNILKADDADKIELAHNAGGMLAIAENTFDQIEMNDYWQIFEGDQRNTAVYFREEFGKFDEFIERVRKLKKPTSVYVFSWEKELDFNEFEDDKNITVKTIPQPILEIYKQIYNLV